MAKGPMSQEAKIARELAVEILKSTDKAAVFVDMSALFRKAGAMSEVIAHDDVDYLEDLISDALADRDIAAKYGCWVFSVYWNNTYVFSRIAGGGNPLDPDKLVASGIVDRYDVS